MEKIKCFYELLEETLKGKKVRLRSYGDTHGFPGGYNSFIYNKDKIIGWNNNVKFEEWTGTVKAILQNDNSHVDIIFDKKLPRTKPSKDHYDDCFNWHMGDYIEIIS